MAAIGADSLERPADVGPELMGRLSGNLDHFLYVVDFPGDHTGYWSHPDEFAAILADVLAEPTRKSGREDVDTADG